MFTCAAAPITAIIRMLSKGTLSRCSCVSTPTLLEAAPSRRIARRCRHLLLEMEMFCPAWGRRVLSRILANETALDTEPSIRRSEREVRKARNTQQIGGSRCAERDAGDDHDVIAGLSELSRERR